MSGVFFQGVLMHSGNAACYFSGEQGTGGFAGYFEVHILVYVQQGILVLRVYRFV